MRIDELSIGDWAKVNGSRTKVWYLSEDGEVNDTTYDWVEPIPLTAEILEKNGLEYVDDGNDAVIFLCCDMFWARLCVGDTFWQVGIHSEDRLDAVVCNVKHTHQLQHALRLAGVEKEIEI